VTGPGGTDADRPAFDPRHDARFQRGYQPGDAPDRPRLIGTPPASTVAEAAEDDTVVDFDTLAFDGEVFQDELESSRWNPFIALLWVLAIVLPAGGMVLQWQAVSGMYRNNSFSGAGEPPVSLVLQQFSYLVAPPLISAGIVILGGLLFWHAAAWRTRRRRMAEDR
jgi:hypothetical protein